MNTSETISALATALAAAQAEMSNAAYNKTNPGFKSRYADLASIREATLPSLNKNGLAIWQGTNVDERDRMVLVTRLFHKSGEWIESTYPIPLSDKPQVMGSALTYARRYAWSAACGITADDDDDAETASKAKTNGNGATDHGVNGADPINASEIAALRAQIVTTGADLPKFLAFMRVDRLDEITVSQLAKAQHALAQKAKVPA